MNKDDLNQYRTTLELFSKELGTYLNNISAYSPHSEIRTTLQRKVPLIAEIVAKVHGGGTYTQDKVNYNFYAVLSYATQKNSPNNKNFDDVKSHVERIINEAIGCIDSGIFPTNEIVPVLPLKDKVLKECLLHH